jgi:hypothetical protein
MICFDAEKGLMNRKVILSLPIRETQSDGSFVLFLFCLHTLGVILCLLFKERTGL